MAISLITPITSAYGYSWASPQESSSARNSRAHFISSDEDQGPQTASTQPSEQQSTIQRPVVPPQEARASTGQPESESGQSETTQESAEEQNQTQAAPEDEPQKEEQPPSQSLGRPDLNPQQQTQVRQLQQRDREVRAHEQAHIAAGGGHVRGGARYQYQTGPDGKRYAVGGEVSIDASEANTPEATIRKAQTIRKAALAPAKPSAQDRAVAAKATQMERQARAELAQEQQKQAMLAGRQAEQGMLAQAAAGLYDKSEPQETGADYFPAQTTSQPPPLGARLASLSQYI